MGLPGKTISGLTIRVFCYERFSFTVDKKNRTEPGNCIQRAERNALKIRVETVERGKVNGTGGAKEGEKEETKKSLVRRRGADNRFFIVIYSAYRLGRKGGQGRAKGAAYFQLKT